MENKQLDDVLENYVNVDNRFLISKYLVTQGEYKEVMGVNPSYFQGEKDLPAEYVNWYNAIEFCNKKSLIYGLEPVYTINGKNIEMDKTKNGFRLPTEEEWEYAAKGGSKTQGFEYAGSDDPDEVAWYEKNSGGKTHPVGLKKANELGLYDMSGNVWEWCWDLYESTQKYRVLRGGGWDNDYNNLCSSYRSYITPASVICDGGFRCVQSI